MPKIIDLSANEAKDFFLKGTSYFNNGLPRYIGFEKILKNVDTLLAGKKLSDFCAGKANNCDNVNYRFTANKDGRLSWRPFELIHPAIYVGLVAEICDEDNWELIKERHEKFLCGVVNCCSWPIVSDSDKSDKAEQISTWWQEVEQKSIELSLKFDHLIHTDVTDCYGSVYTHSIAWALHTRPFMKKQKNKKNKNLLGNKIDYLIMACRNGQTNGIPQGSVLMDFIAELVLGWVDLEISAKLKNNQKWKVDKDFQILRYRDDYRIFANSDAIAEEILKTISEALHCAGMKLATAKTVVSPNVIEGAIKPDKWAAITLQDMNNMSATTMQKKLLGLHAFGRHYPNSGTLRRLLSAFQEKITKEKVKPKDLVAQVAIAVDIGITSPLAFPAVASILSHLISFAEPSIKQVLWGQVQKKMRGLPHNGYLDIWLQRVTIPKASNFKLKSDERICQIVNGENVQLWGSDWLNNYKLKEALDSKNIIIEEPHMISQTVAPSEIELFTKHAQYY